MPQRGRLVLEAIAAERMPHRLVVHGVERAEYFELRDYGSAEIAGVLERCGVRAVWADRGRFLFAFESLEARESAWRRVGVAPAGMGAGLREIAVYRTKGISRRDAELAEKR